MDATPQPGSRSKGFADVVRAVHGVIFANEGDGEYKLVALIKGVKHFVTRDADSARAFDAAFHFDMTRLGLLAVNGRRIGREIPPARPVATRRLT